MITFPSSSAVCTPSPTAERDAKAIAKYQHFLGKLVSPTHHESQRFNHYNRETKSINLGNCTYCQRQNLLGMVVGLEFSWECLPNLYSRMSCGIPDGVVAIVLSGENLCLAWAESLCLFDSDPDKEIPDEGRASAPVRR